MTIGPNRKEELAKIAVETLDIEQIHTLPVYDRPTTIIRYGKQILNIRTPEDPFVPEPMNEGVHEELLFVVGSMRDELLARDESVLRWQS